jgi:hypothetical protein
MKDELTVQAFEIEKLEVRHEMQIMVMGCAACSAQALARPGC